MRLNCVNFRQEMAGSPAAGCDAVMQASALLQVTVERKMVRYRACRPPEDGVVALGLNRPAQTDLA